MTTASSVIEVEGEEGVVVGVVVVSDLLQEKLIATIKGTK
jgi:L-aminopeptidase/D-esterase-like protein